MSEFLILTYCDDTSNQVYKKLTSQLKIITLPIYMPWSWDFYPKSYSVLENIKNVNAETVVLVCDSFDVLPIDKLTNESLFEAIKNNFDLEKITFNAEKICYPKSDLANIYPKINTEWKYLNGGIYVGKAGKIKTMLEGLLPKINGTIDQEVFSVAFLNKEYDIELDYYCKVFQTLAALDESDLTIENNKIINNKTNTEPVLLHGNGKSGIEKFLNYAN